MKKQRDRGTPAARRGKPPEQLQPREQEGAPKIAEPESNQTSREWEATFNAITDLISIIDTDFKVVRVNSAFTHTLNKIPQELLGHKCYEIVHGSAEPWVSCPHKQALQTGKPVTEEFWEPHLEKYLQVSVSPIFNDEHKMTGSVHVVRDISERRKAEEVLRESEERFRLTFDQSPVGAALLDVKDGHFARTNAAFCRFTGYSEEESAQLTFRDITYPDDLAVSIEQTRLLLAGQIDGFEMEKRYIRKKGSTVWGHLSVQPVKDSSGRILYTLAMVQDITDRKRAELRLRASEEATKSLLNATSDVACLLDTEGTLIAANGVLAEHLDRDVDRLIGQNIFDFFPQDLARLRWMRAQEVVEKRRPARFEDASLDGSYFESCIYPLFDADGKVVRLAVYAKDITEARHASRALAESEARFKQFFDSINDGISVRNAQTFELVDANQRFCDMYGYTLEELKALPLGSLAGNESPDERQRRLRAYYAEVTEGVSRLFEAEGRRKDGSTFWVEVNVRRIALGGRESLLAVARDITKRRKADKALKLSEEAALRLAQETGVIAEIGRIISSSLDIEEVYERFAETVRKLIPSVRIVLNLINRQEGTLTTAYTAGMEVAGRNKGVVFPVAGTITEEMIRTEAPLLFHLESVEEIRNRFPGLVPAFQAGLRSRLSVPLIARGEVIGSLALWSKQKKAYGEKDVWLAQNVASQIAGAIANARLFRERKQAEEALRESEESYRSLVETSPDAIFLHDEGRFVYLNPAAVRLYGAGNAEELYGKNAYEIVHPDDREAIQSRTYFVMTTGVSAPLKEIRIVRADGSVVDVEATAGISHYRGKKVMQVIQRDITERKRTEEKIRASLREKEVLLKEIHHRVKNNLQIISSLLYLQSSRTEHPGAVSALRESRARIKSMALIHERLYASPDLASVDMGKYTRSLVSDLKQSHMTEDGLVRLVLNLEDIPLGIIEAIPCGLIINELVSNALKHAFPEGKEGEITIRLRRTDATQVMLTVSDNGVGFPEHVDFRKSPSLGLTLINSLVEQLNGTIQLDRGGGTTFTITFG